MQLRKATKSATVALALALGLAAGAASATEQLDEAMLAYERGRYVEAHTQLLVAAHQGDPQAQEIVGFMYAFGPHLYPGVPRDLRAAAHWFGRAAQSGRPVARHMQCVLSRRGIAPAQC